MGYASRNNPRVEVYRMAREGTMTVYLKQSPKGSAGETPNPVEYNCRNWTMDGFGNLGIFDSGVKMLVGIPAHNYLYYEFVPKEETSD